MQNPPLQCSGSSPDLIQMSPGRGGALQAYPEAVMAALSTRTQYNSQHTIITCQMK